MLEFLMTPHLPLLIAAPISLLLFQKTEFYLFLKRQLNHIAHYCLRAITFTISSVKDDLSYRAPSKRQQKPIKNASKIAGWILIAMLVLYDAWLILFGTSIFLLATLENNLTVFTMSTLFFALCINVAYWVASCAHKAAWQNGIKILLKQP